VNQALDLADQAYVLSNGVITYSGPAQSLDRNRLMSDYLSQPSLGV
jgi:ABC-type branched-subunit amino acid transport system ATPase component